MVAGTSQTDMRHNAAPDDFSRRADSDSLVRRWWQSIDDMFWMEWRCQLHLVFENTLYQCWPYLLGIQCGLPQKNSIGHWTFIAMKANVLWSPNTSYITCFSSRYILASPINFVIRNKSIAGVSSMTTSVWDENPRRHLLCYSVTLASWSTISPDFRHKLHSRSAFWTFIVCFPGLNYGQWLKPTFFNGSHMPVPRGGVHFLTLLH